MSFEVSAVAYGRFMGRFSEPLAERFVALASAQAGQRALDVGCGPGALTAALIARLGGDAVSAVDPSEPFVEAMQSRFPSIDVRQATAERLPFHDDTFDLAAAQLVVHFMADPVSGLAEMARVTRPGGLVAASVWDHAGGGSPLSLFWQAVRQADPEVRDESSLAGAREGHLAELFDRAGLHDIAPSSLSVTTSFATFEDWWEPYLLGVGPAGAYVGSLDVNAREELQARCAALLPPSPFDIEASAWTVLGRV